VLNVEHLLLVIRLVIIELVNALISKRLERLEQLPIVSACLLLVVFFAAGSPAVACGAEAQAIKLEPTLHARAMETAKSLPRLRSLLISIDGTLVEERYFNGARAAQPANLKSASKSLLSILVGIALDRGYLGSVRDRIDKFFPEHLGGADNAAKKAITIEDLLTMRSGLEATSNVNYGRWVQSSNWVRYVLSRPLLDVPGGAMIYSTGNSHLLSALLTRAAKMSTFEFARRYLAVPLGISLGPWPRDPQGIYFGGNEMHLTPRDMLEVGKLYLNGGRAGGKQVVAETWIRESLKPRTRSRWSGREYGYGWWIDTLAGQPTYYAWGHGGQFIFVVPDLKLVLAATSVPEPGEGRRDHQRAIYDLVEHDLIPAVETNRLSLIRARRSREGSFSERPPADIPLFP
jgi:CubicO group peptidase (beta-lactamase class C family)